MQQRLGSSEPGWPQNPERCPLLRQKAGQSLFGAQREQYGVERAASLLEGTHDFRSFQAGGGDAKGTVRTLYRCAVEPRSAADSHGYDLIVEGDGFLYKMVRLIAGTLVGVGMGLVPPEAVVEALGAPHAGSESSEAPDELRRRGVVGPTLPPLPLTLEHVEYETDHPAHVCPRRQNMGRCR